MTPPRLELRTTGTPPRVVIGRADGVPDAFWTRLRGEFSDAIRATTSRLEVAADRFLRGRRTLRSMCRDYRVGLRVDERTRKLLQRRNQEEASLWEAVEEEPRLSEDVVRSALEDTRFRRELRPFQLRDLRRLLALPHAANFSVPGAGKTCVTYALYEAERSNGRVDQMLVVAPLSAFRAWEREADESLNPTPRIDRYDGQIDLRAEVVLTGYQRLLTSYDDLAGWALSGRTHVILDEAHRMKRGWEGAWGTTCLNLAYTAQRRDILTGTPAPNHPTDLEALLDFLWPSQGHHLLPEQAKSNNPSIHATREISERIGPLFVRTQKSELGLADPILTPIRVPLQGLQRQIYDALLDRYSGLFHLSRRDQIDLAQMGEIVMYLLEAATNPALLVTGSSSYEPDQFQHPPLPVTEDSELRQLLENYPDYETPPKFVELGARIKRNADMGRKTLIWTNFVANILTLKRELAGYKPALVYGGVPAGRKAQADERSREEEIERFRHDPDCQVLLANPAATAEGISLHDVCHDAIYLERTFNAGQYLQSLDRIHRLGLPDDQDTRISFLITEETIDEVVHSRIDEKAERLGQLLDDPDIRTMALPDEEQWGSAIAPEDKEALFAHLRGDSRD